MRLTAAVSVSAVTLYPVVKLRVTLKLKQNTKIALCSVTAALAVAVMLASYFPYLTYAVPALAGLFIMMPLIEINTRWAFSAYAVSAVLTIIFAEPESAVMYLCFFGYYPIIKALIEHLHKTVVEWIIKIAVFNIAVISGYALLTFVMGISVEDIGELGKYGAYILLGFGNIVFVLYDIAISRMSVLYMIRLHPHIKKLLK